MTLLAQLFADEAAKPEQAQPGPFGNPIFFMVMIGLFMFTMLWLPQRRQRRELQTMLAALKPGAKIITSAGIVGTVVKLKDGDEEMVIRSEDTKLKITRSSVVRVLGIEDEAKS